MTIDIGENLRDIIAIVIVYAFLVVLVRKNW